MQAFLSMAIWLKSSQPMNEKNFVSRAKLAIDVSSSTPDAFGFTDPINNVPDAFHI